MLVGGGDAWVEERVATSAHWTLWELVGHVVVRGLLAELHGNQCVCILGWRVSRVSFL